MAEESKCAPLAEALAQMAYNLGEQGAKDFDDVVSRMVEAVPGITRKEILESIEAFEASKPKKQPLNIGVRGEALMEQRLVRRIEKRLGQIEARKFDKAPARKARFVNESIEELRRIRASVDKAARVGQRESELVGEIDRLIEQIESGNYETAVKTSERLADLDDRIFLLENRRDQAKRLVRRKIDERTRSPGLKALDAVRSPFRLMGSIITGGEFSGFLNQGGFFSFGNPRIGKAAYLAGLKAFRSEGGEARVTREIQGSRNYVLGKRAGLFLSDQLDSREEAFLSRALENVPVYGGTARFHRSVLNKMRQDAFDMMVDGLGRNGDVTLKEAKGIAEFVNAATGRSGFGKHEGAAAVMADLAFAPRYYWSRIQILSGYHVWRPGQSGRVRVAVAKQYGRYLVGLAAMYALAQLAGSEIESDPRSTDFGKFKHGETRLNPLSGLQQFITFGARMFTGTTKNYKGQVKPIRQSFTLGRTGKPQYGSRDAADVLFDFARSKSSPMAGFAADIFTGENFRGQPTTPATLATRIAGPITYRDLYQLWRSDLGLSEKAVMSLLGFHGAFLQTYGPQTDAQMRSDWRSVKSKIGIESKAPPSRQQLQDEIRRRMRDRVQAAPAPSGQG